MIVLAIASAITSVISGIKWFKANRHRKIFSENVRYSSLPDQITWSPQMVQHANKANISFVISLVTGSFSLWWLSTHL